MSSFMGACSVTHDCEHKITVSLCYSPGLLLKTLKRTLSYTKLDLLLKNVSHIFLFPQNVALLFLPCPQLPAYLGLLSG